MGTTDEVMQALDSLGKAALNVKRQRDLLYMAFGEIQKILREAEVEYEQTHSAEDPST